MYPGRRFALPWAISFCPFGAGTSQPYRVGTVPGFSPNFHAPYTGFESVISAMTGYDH
jgi:hypothetical protein